MRILGGMTAARFLAEYWQRQPLLVRNAWPNFADPLEPEELAGLACEEEVNARLVLEHGQEQGWALRYGPFAESDFTALPVSHWSLLVSDMEKYLPELEVLLDPFRFIPDWRIDDLQISYAPAQGSVGPHWDDYDVFLLQGRGRKRWQISTAAVTADNVLSDSDLRLLRHFQPEQDWVLEPGDLLYLPPRVAHHGIALEPCLTYSIGFRAPDQAELVDGFIDDLLSRLDPAQRYRDPPLQATGNPGLIDAAAVQQAERLLRQALQWQPQQFAHWFGRFVTEPKPGFEPQPSIPELSLAELREALQANTLERRPGARLCGLPLDEGLLLCVDGRAFQLGVAQRATGEYLCRQRHYPWHELLPLLSPETMRLLLALVNAGHLLIGDP